MPDLHFRWYALVNVATGVIFGGIITGAIAYDFFKRTSQRIERLADEAEERSKNTVWILERAVNYLLMLLKPKHKEKIEFEVRRDSEGKIEGIRVDIKDKPPEDVQKG